MVAILQYFRERFPIIPVFLFSIGYAGYVIGLSSHSTTWSHNLFSNVVLLFTVAGLFAAFLLRQRAVDEWRDFDHDAKNFPHRPLHRGLISRRQISLIGLIAFLLELLFAQSIGAFWAYIPVLLYSFLMAKDFFIKQWLEHHFTSHFLIHEVFFFILGGYFIISLNDFPWSLHLWLTGLPVLVAAPMSIELIRKYKPRYNPQGKAVQDTYSTVWGRSQTVIFLMTLTLIVGTGLHFSKPGNYFLPLSLLFTLSLWHVRRHDGLVIVLGAVQFLTLAFLSNLL